jgi:hypothetical protein
VPPSDPDNFGDGYFSVQPSGSLPINSQAWVGARQRESRAAQEAADTPFVSAVRTDGDSIPFKPSADMANGGIGGLVVALIILVGVIVGLTPNGLERYFGIKRQDPDHQYNLHKDATVSGSNVILRACSDVSCPQAAHLPEGFKVVLTSHVREKGLTDGRFVDWGRVSITTAGGNVVEGYVDESQVTVGSVVSEQSLPPPTFQQLGIKTSPFYINSDAVVVGGDVTVRECLGDACRATGHLRSGQHVRVAGGPFDMPDSYAPNANHTIWYIVSTCATNTGAQCTSGSIRASRLKSAS